MSLLVELEVVGSDAEVDELVRGSGAEVGAFDEDRPVLSASLLPEFAFVEVEDVFVAILDIDTRDPSVAGRVTSLATARGFGAGVDLHLTSVDGTSALKIILTGPIGGVLDTAAALRRVLELTHD